MKHHSPLYLIPLILLITCTQPTEPVGFVMDDKPVNQLAADYVHAVIEPDGTIWAWGHNYFGTLGNGTVEDSDFPVKVLNISEAVVEAAVIDVTQLTDGDRCRCMQSALSTALCRSLIAFGRAEWVLLS